MRREEYAGRGPKYCQSILRGHWAMVCRLGCRAGVPGWGAGEACAHVHQDEVQQAGKVLHIRMQYPLHNSSTHRAPPAHRSTNEHQSAVLPAWMTTVTFNLSQNPHMHVCMLHGTHASLDRLDKFVRNVAASPICHMLRSRSISGSLTR